MSNVVEPSSDYKELLDGDLRWAFMEGSRHFDEKSRPFLAMRKIGQRLDELGIVYAVLGDLSMFRHGHRRYTEVLELLVTREDLKTIHQRLIGDDYALDRPNSKSLRDVEFGVKILFSLTGDYPGDGKPKPVAFPNPASVEMEIGGIRFVNLETLIELKLASGMSNAGRIKDLGDVQELIRTLDLPTEFGDELNLYVQPAFTELWNGVENSKRDTQ
jgi:hypothetical protein